MGHVNNTPIMYFQDYVAKIFIMLSLLEYALLLIILHRGILFSGTRSYVYLSGTESFEMISVIKTSNDVQTGAVYIPGLTIPCPAASMEKVFLTLYTYYSLNNYERSRKYS